MADLRLPSPGQDGPAPVRHRGRVASWDRAVGLGTVEADVGAGRYPFHAVAVGDGSRDVELGAAVTFVVVAGSRGRWEAMDVRVV